MSGASVLRASRLFCRDASHRVYKGSRRGTSRSCAGEHPPAAAAPCVPPARPPCRQPPATASRTGVYKACCPPPRGSRPPCTVKSSGRTRTCADAISTAEARPAYERPSEEECGRGQDRVARRLAAAEAARRAAYEAEAGEPLCASCAPAAPYALGAARCRSRATDGRMYSLPCAPPVAGQCSEDREPPPPRCVPLQPDDKCRPTDDNLVDPCAHRPRTFVEIARPADISTRTSRGFTSRIMDTLSLGRRADAPGKGTCRNSRGDRRFHTSSSTGASVAATCGNKIENNETKLEQFLKERAQLKEAGRGRVAAECGGRGAGGAGHGGGRLELGVPPGAARVCVNVTLHDDPSGGCKRDRKSPVTSNSVPRCPAAAPVPSRECPAPAPPTPPPVKPSGQSPCLSPNTKKFMPMMLTT